MTNKFLKLGFMLLLFFMAACLSDNSAPDAGKNMQSVTYTCSMHPQVMQSKPGACPICKMDLVLQAHTNTSNELIINDAQIRLAGIKTNKVNVSKFSTDKILNARFIVNPEQSNIISNKYPGRLEKLFVTEIGQTIVKGQPLFQIFSEQLQALQQDYVLQLKQAAAFPNEKIYKTLIKAAENKLLLYGFTNQQLTALAKHYQVSPSITVKSPIAGILNEVTSSAGQYIAEGSPVLRIEDLSSLWLEADIYPSEISAVALGKMLKVIVKGTNQVLSAKVSFINPEINPSTQLISIRAVVQNRSGNLQPGMQASVFLPQFKFSGIALPQSAVIRDEQGSIIWVKKDKHTFYPLSVVTGAENADQIVITSGIHSTLEIVINGAYLLQSEYILNNGNKPSAVPTH